LRCGSGDRCGIEMEALPVRPLPVLMFRLPERPKTVNTAVPQE
jgi:hypothetical protein